MPDGIQLCLLVGWMQLGGHVGVAVAVAVAVDGRWCVGFSVLV